MSRGNVRGPCSPSHLTACPQPLKGMDSDPFEPPQWLVNHPEVQARQINFNTVVDPVRPPCPYLGYSAWSLLTLVSAVLRFCRLF